MKQNRYKKVMQQSVCVDQSMFHLVKEKKFRKFFDEIPKLLEFLVASIGRLYWTSKNSFLTLRPQKEATKKTRTDQMVH